MTRQSTRPHEAERPIETGADARRKLMAAMPISEQRLTLNRVSTTVLMGGEGPPIVLLHGPGEYAAKWLSVIPDLVTTHRVIAPDLPAHGTSGVPDGPSDVARMIGWLDDLIECTCPTPPVLVGQILAGAIAIRFASDRGDRLSRLVLVDTLGLAPFRPAPEFGGALGAFVSSPSEATHEALWRQCAFDLDAMRARLGEKWDWIKAYNLDRARASELGPVQQELMERFGLPAIPHDELDRIPVPTTLIWGRHDLATPLSVAESASSRHGWPLHVIENAADDPPLEQPEAFLNALRGAIAPATGR